jgi:polyisoprenoid-binding protein YceI
MRKSLNAILLAGAVLAAVTLYPAMADNHAAKSPSLPGQQDVSRVAAGSYAVDPNHTLVSWRVDHFGFNDYYGLFGNITGTLQIDPAAPDKAIVDITIPVAEVTTASKGLTDHLLRPGKDGGKPDFFGPEPAAARFVSTAVEIGEIATEAKITGDLTLNDMTKPVTIMATFQGAGANPFNKKETVGFHGKTTIKRSEFGIAYALPFVSDEVHLKISAAFEKQ